MSKELFFVRKESKSLTNHRDDMKSLFPIAAAASIASLAMGVEAYDSRRQLEEVATSRHSFSASSLEIDFNGEYFCKPDGDGYFGSTMGNSVPVTYGLAIEYSPDADLFSIFSQISHLVEKTLLTYFFPEECKYSTNRIRKARILSDVPLTGFRFTRELEKMPGEFQTSKVDQTSEINLQCVLLTFKLSSLFVCRGLRGEKYQWCMCNLQRRRSCLWQCRVRNYDENDLRQSRE